jgi:hypothetical protein
MHVRAYSTERQSDSRKNMRAKATAFPSAPALAAIAQKAFKIGQKRTRPALI